MLRDKINLMFRRNLLKITTISFVLFILIETQALAFWMWTQQSKKWTNPEWSAKNSPKEQFDFAKQIFDAGDYKTAITEFKKVLRHFPESYEAAEAQFYIGESLEKMDKLYDAYLAYQKVIDKYPFSDKMNTILKREFDIAEALSEKKDQVLGLTLTGQYYAINIYRRIIDNAPYGDLASLSQYRIGLVMKDMGRFDEAKTEFEKVASAYPDSQWLEPAKYQIALCASLASRKPDYDQELTQEAKKRFDEFVNQHPDAELAKDAAEKISTLTDKEAEKDFNTAQFYEKQKAYSSAAMYYESVIKKYPKTIWAQKAFEKIQALDEEEKL